MENAIEQKKPVVKLVGQDGNAFAIIGACRKAARKFGWPNETWQKVQAEMMAGDYNHLLQIAMKYFNVQ